MRRNDGFYSLWKIAINILLLLVFLIKVGSGKGGNQRILLSPKKNLSLGGER
jgi:hypothetical protein